MTPTVQELLSRNGIHPKSHQTGPQYLLCPQCSATRKPHNRKKKCLSLQIDGPNTAYWMCHNCGWSGPEKESNSHFDNNRRFEYPNGNYKIKNENGPRKYYSWEHESIDGIIRRGAKELENLLYRIDEARENGGIIAVVEGEKDAETLWKLGVPAVTSPHGAAQPGQKPKWNAEHSRQLKGLDIVVLNDNDEPGYAHANAVIECSIPFCKSIRRLDLKPHWPGKNMPEGADISDFAAEIANQENWEEQIKELIRNAPIIAKPKPALPWLTPFNDLDPIPDLEWAVKDLIPLRTVSLFSGEGGTGKSISSLHLCTAHTLSLTWLNWFPEPGPAWYIDAEDPSNIIHFRLDKIRQLYQTTFSAMFSRGLKIMSLAGQDSLMATTAKNNTIEPTNLYKLLLEEAADTKPKMIAIASAANVFAGNENDRPQVRQFISLLERIAIAANGSILLISHPSLTGITSRSGLSGSTQWHNSVRSRMVLRTPQHTENEEEPETDLRELVFFKNQYGPQSLKLTLKWKNGLFLPEESGNPTHKLARESKAEEIFLTLTRRFNETSRPISDSPASPGNYAPKAFAKEPEAKSENITRPDLEQAMTRLFKGNRIRIHEWGPPSKPRRSIFVS